MPNLWAHTNEEGAMSLERDDLSILFGEAQAALRVLQSIPQRIERRVFDCKVREGNSEEKRIGLAFQKAVLELAGAMDMLGMYTWHTYVVEHYAKCAQDACYLAEGDARKEYGEVLEVLCVERVATEYATQIRWRVTMREPAEKEEASDES